MNEKTLMEEIFEEKERIFIKKYNKENGFTFGEAFQILEKSLALYSKKTDNNFMQSNESILNLLQALVERQFPVDLHYRICPECGEETADDEDYCTCCGRAIVDSANKGERRHLLLLTEAQMQQNALNNFVSLFKEYKNNFEQKLNNEQIKDLIILQQMISKATPKKLTCKNAVSNEDHSDNCMICSVYNGDSSQYCYSCGQAIDHIDNQALYFDEIERGMWMWDNKTKDFCRVISFKSNRTLKLSVPTYKNGGCHWFRVEECLFEENRFFGNEV